MNTRRSFPIIYISAYSFVVECWEEYCAILGKRPFAAASVDPVGNILVLMEREGGRPTADVCALLGPLAVHDEEYGLKDIIGSSFVSCIGYQR